MKEHLIGLTASAAAVPAALGFGIHKGEVKNYCEPQSAPVTQTLKSEESPVRQWHLYDLPDEVKVVVTLGAVALTAGAANRALRGKDYGDDVEKGSDWTAAGATAAFGLSVIAATWISDWSPATTAADSITSAVTAAANSIGSRIEF